MFLHQLYDIFKSDSESFVISRAVSSNFAARISMRGPNVSQVRPFFEGTIKIGIQTNCSPNTFLYLTTWIQPGASKDEAKKRALIGEFLVAQVRNVNC